MAKKRIAILGGGITGLTAAFELTRAGHDIRLFEQSSRTGGMIRTERTEGWLVEGGPVTILSGDAEVDALIRDLGLENERVTAGAETKNRFVVRRGRVMPVPLSPGQLLTTGLFSPQGKLRILSELLTRPRTRTVDLSLGEFIHSHFGHEFRDYVMDPFVTGVYAGDLSKLSARHAFPRFWDFERRKGSLARGQLAAAKARKARGDKRPAVTSFRHGLQTLTDALAARLPAGALALGAKIDAIMPGSTWSVIWHDGVDTRTETFDAIVAALPAPALAQLRIGSLGERPLAALDTMEHAAVTSLFVGFHREQVSHPLDGFGLLAPTLERRSLLGVLFCSTLFPNRAPEGHVALTVMVGGTRHPELAALPPEQLWPKVRDDLANLLGVKGEPVFSRTTPWRRAIPQYNLGHERFLAAIAACERSHPGLHIGGPARDGIGLPQCILAGKRIAAAASR